MKVTIHMKDGPDQVYDQVWNLMLLGGGILAIYRRGPLWDYDAGPLDTSNDYGPNHKILANNIVGWTTDPEPLDPKAISIRDVIEAERHREFPPPHGLNAEENNNADFDPRR